MMREAMKRNIQSDGCQQQATHSSGGSALGAPLLGAFMCAGSIDRFPTDESLRYLLRRQCRAGKKNYFFNFVGYAS